MATVLSFKARPEAQRENVKNDTSEVVPRTQRSRPSVVSTVLATGGRLPILVDAATWVSMSMALR